jgi:hypothetical protein
VGADLTLTLSARRELVSEFLGFDWLAGFIVAVGVLIFTGREGDFDDRLAVAEPDEELEREELFLTLKPSEEPKAGYANAAELNEAGAGRFSPGFALGAGGGGRGSASFASNPLMLNDDFPEPLVDTDPDRFGSLGAERGLNS